MRRIINHPEEHDQGVWICGTRACLAGHIALQAGAHGGPGTLRSDVGYITMVDGELVSVKEFAQQRAGLTRAEAQHLFSAAIGLDELCHDTVRITMDRAANCHSTELRESYHHIWTNLDGEIIAAAHRCTAFFRTGKHDPVIEFTTRHAAHAYASVVAGGLHLYYTRNEEPPEVPQ